MAQLAVVHVDGALPGDGLGIDVELVALLDVVVEHGREQVVGSTDGMEVAGEVQVDVLHRHDLGIAAAGSSALDAEDGPQGGLAQRDDHVLADLAHAVGQAHGRGGLALARRRRRDGRHEDELAVRLVGVVLEHRDVVDLGHVLAVGLEVLLVDARLRGDLDDGLHLASLRDFDVRWHVPLLLLVATRLAAAFARFLSCVAHVGDATDILHR